jgi:PAS domain S-box-containing protein
MDKKVKCWEVFDCNQQDCPAYQSKELRCWLISGTRCREAIQGQFLEKIEMCIACEPFNKNMDSDAWVETLKVVEEQFSSFRRMVEQRDQELEGISMELALGLSEVFEALKRISSGDPRVKIPETSKLELMTRLKQSVNLTAKNLAEIVDLSHEFAIGLAEHFAVLHRVSNGDLSARVSEGSRVELLESLNKVMNEMIESVSREMTQRKLTEEALQRAHDQLEIRVEQRTADLKREIAERQRVEEALRASEELYRSFVQSFQGIAFRGHIDFTPIFFHGSVEEITGYTEEELTKGNPRWDQVIHPDDLTTISESIQKITSMPDYLADREYRIIRKDGDIRWVHEIIQNLCDKSGKPVIVQGAIHDVTDRKRAEEALRESERRFRDFLDDLGDLAYEADSTGEMTYVNKAVEIVAGMPRKDIIGKPFLPFLTSESQEVAAEAFKKTLNAETPEYELTLINGRICHFKNQPQRDKEDKIVGVFGTARDITNRKIAEQRLGIYHDKLRTMASKLSLAEEQERRRIATEVHDSIGQNLAFAKIKLGTLIESTSSSSVRPMIEEIGTLVDEAIQDTRSLISELGSPVLHELGFVPALQWLAQQLEKRHHIATDFEDDGQPKPLSDDVGVLFYQAARELLANIVRHSRADSAKVSVMRNRDQIQVVVADNGVGFDPAEISPGMDDQRSRFGLFSIRERLEPLGGRMEMASEPGQGTKVILTGPLEAPGQRDTGNAL